MVLRRHEVVVVGGGVVGASSALAFLREGFDVALVERGPRPAPFRPEAHDARVYAIAPASVRFLEALGAWKAVREARAGAYERMRVWERSPGRALGFDAAELGVPELGFIVEDSLLRASLWSALGAASVRTGVGVADCEFGPGRSRLKLGDGDVLEAALVVAAEGAESKLRERAGLESGGWHYPQRSITCHVETAQMHRRTAFQRFLPGGPLAFLPLADGRSSIVWSTTTAEAEALMALPDEAFRARLSGAIDDVLGPVRSATPRLAFPLRLLHASEYVREGLALVGDSAHVIHPLAGQGVNLGLADAEALAAVAAAARDAKRPIGRRRVLQRYERARQAANLEVMALTDALHRLFRSRAPGVAALRELGMGLVERSGPLKHALARRAMG
jgi:2-polyprenylphenol 6-hydroxylase